MILNLSHRLDYNALVSMISLWNMVVFVSPTHIQPSVTLCTKSGPIFLHLCRYDCMFQCETLPDPTKCALYSSQ